MRDDFQRRLQAAARGDAPKTSHPLDAHLRALVRQLEDKTAAPTTNAYRVLKDPRPRTKRNR